MQPPLSRLSVALLEVSLSVYQTIIIIIVYLPNNKRQARRGVQALRADHYSKLRSPRISYSTLGGGLVEADRVPPYNLCPVFEVLCSGALVAGQRDTEAVNAAIHIHGGEG